MTNIQPIVIQENTANIKEVLSGELKHVRKITVSNTFTPYKSEDFCPDRSEAIIYLEDEDIEFASLLTCLKDLETLVVINIPFAGQLESLEQCSTLKNLSLIQSHIDDDCIQQLALLSNLIHLNLQGNHLRSKGVAQLSALRQLTTVNLSSNRIDAQGVETLAALPNLTSLHLSNNKLGSEGARALSTLSNLNTLNLSYNQITPEGAECITSLKQLYSLDLSGNNVGLEGVKAVTTLAGLTALNISNNQLEKSEGKHAFNAIAKLTALKSLKLNFNRVGPLGIKALKPLEKLTELSMESCDIGNEGIKLLANFKQLTHLNLVNNRIGSLGAKELTTLTQLKVLNLGGESQKIYHKDHLHQQYLNEWQNRIKSSGANHLSTLQKLTTLNLSNNEIGPDGAKALASLNNLITLDLSKNKIGADGIGALSSFKKLTSLNIAHTGLTARDQIDLSSFPMLKLLDISKNSIENTESIQLYQPSQLITLNLSNNPISDLTPFEELIRQGLTPLPNQDGNFANGIGIFDCPIKNPPPEIIERGKNAILNYFTESKAQGTDLLCEAKMLVVGEGGAGKTSLIRRLYKPDKGLPREEETTKGIDIEPVHFNLPNNRPFRLNVWDFGGQHIYHATHQFFLTKRSLYVLVDSSRTNDKTVQDEAFRYWLEVIDTLSDSSPVLIFQNHVGGRSKSIDERGIQKRFTNVKEFHGANLATRNSVDKVKSSIEYHAQSLEHIGDNIPAKWVVIRRALENLAKSKPFISLDEYFKLYREHIEFNRERALFLSQYFHDLGVFLHFQDDPMLNKIVILQNNWATEAVFNVLDDSEITARLGRFTSEDCNRIWSNANYENVRGELLALMCKFELCYELADSIPKTWLATQLLPASMPETLENWPREGDISLLYRYDFLPKGIINRLMVRMNRFVNDPTLAWNYGILFKKGETQLLAQETGSGNEISLRARGPEAKSLLSVIANDIDTINHSFTGLRHKVKKFIPCICAECRNSDDPHLYGESHLLRRKDRNSLQVECEKSFQKVNVLELLDGLKLSIPGWAKEPHPTLSPSPTNEPAPKTNTPIKLKTIKVFLASSSELKYERDAFDLYFRRQNDHYKNINIHLEIIRWEYFLDAMSETRLQDEYNKAIEACDIFVSLFKTKTGKYIEEEFDTAHKQFKNAGKPKIYTYFQETEVPIHSLDLNDLISLRTFQEKLKALGHFHTTFKSKEDLHLKFKDQLQILSKDLIATH
ncbi:COR domain-containing protein [Halioxenophilus sp. WMMB6]|uniref:COR domain-containing protein n=1 Tax=Halioxenophilus sp. WMMB6 TaxID=3073815 RepID=UPI00295E353E|nr:COR domain-containing protein [Halioxenophilus sp. WMMB6]